MLFPNDLSDDTMCFATFIEIGSTSEATKCQPYSLCPKIG